MLGSFLSSMKQVERRSLGLDICFFLIQMDIAPFLGINSFTLRT
jgi:hypothetical protein